MMRKLFYFVIPIISTGMMLSSCNKNDVIEDPDSSGGGGYRPATSTSDCMCNKVYEYTPAPGQFINDPTSGGMRTEIKSAAEAAEWAMERMQAGGFASLGGFGGYIVVGFDHSIKTSANGGYEIGVAGNSFTTASTAINGSSNEPGIVYVMQDTNGNGLPDDTWYELKGSEYGSDKTIKDYSVTYYRPSAPETDIRWTDSRGEEGTIEYLKNYHHQEYYYPMWIAGDSYTLSGVCLKSQTSQDEATGNWANRPYGWGYADNTGSDNVTRGSFTQCNRFRISDAVDSEGHAADLKYIDFVKIQTGVNAKSGWLGEVSTEVFGVLDLNI